MSNADELSVIADIKRKSPSAGSIAENVSAVDQARNYLNADADALSVLTDQKYFGGELEDLWEVNDFIRSHRRTIPTLRKDFMIHPIQVMEALEAGARAILLIVRALDDDELKTLREAADLARLDCLYEIHEERELEKALSHDPEIIGVNNRDLTRFVPTWKRPNACSLLFLMESSKSAKAASSNPKMPGEPRSRSGCRILRRSPHEIK